ncbi:Histone-lysine N-methyltransferase SETMAR, partial [Harpegnathos saltator]
WEVLPHPPYSPDCPFRLSFVPVDAAGTLTGKRFTSRDTIQKWVDGWIASKEMEFFTPGISLLPERWTKVVTSDGIYF